jgi:glycosyltransferase involved in cell wall biosynthesis
MQNGLVNLIGRLDPGHFEHIICAMRELDQAYAPQSFRGGRVRVISPKRALANSHLQIAGLASLIDEVRPDIVHSRNWGSIEAVIAARWVGSTAVVHSEHGLDSLTVLSEPWRRRIFRRFAFELADRVLCVSNQLRSVHSKRTGFPSSKITVVHNGVDTNRYLPDAAARTRVRQELGLLENDFCVGCLGNLTPVKDYPCVLHAMKIFAKRCDDWRLIVAGEGPELSKLQGIVNANSELTERVSFIGQSNNTPELLNAMDLYVLSSITEGLSNSLLEAMATGLPVVVTKTGGNPEVVNNGESGFLFSVGDVRTLAELILSLRSRKDLRLKLAHGSLERIRKSFSLDIMAQNYERVYESLLNKRNGHKVKTASP